MTSGIYKIINVASGRQYIGSAVNLLTRKGKHFTELRANKHENGYLQNSYNLHGEENFTFEIIEYCSKEKLIEREQLWMDRCKVRGEILYNIREIAESNLGLKWSSESRSKMSAAKKGKNHSPETRAKMSAAHKGKIRPPEHCAKLSAANKGHIISIETREKISVSLRGKVHSVATRAKMSDAHRKRYQGTTGLTSPARSEYREMADRQNE